MRGIQKVKDQSRDGLIKNGSQGAFPPCQANKGRERVHFSDFWDLSFWLLQENGKFQGMNLKANWDGSQGAFPHRQGGGYEAMNQP